MDFCTQFWPGTTYGSTSGMPSSKEDSYNFNYLSNIDKQSLKKQLNELINCKKQVQGQLNNDDYKRILEDLHQSSWSMSLNKAGFETNSTSCCWPFSSNSQATEKVHALLDWLEELEISDTGEEAAPTESLFSQQFNDCLMPSTVILPTVKALKSVLNNLTAKVRQDVVNPYVFTVKAEGKKSYWFFNVITHCYHPLLTYDLPSGGNTSKEQTSIFLGSGAFNKVYSRHNVPEVAIRKPHGRYDATSLSVVIKNTNLMLSLLYSMENHEVISKYINMGFIKSNAELNKKWKMVIPAIKGASLTQMFGIRYCFEKEGAYALEAGIVTDDQRPIVDHAQNAYKQRLKLNGSATLADELEIRYKEFCEHAKSHGYDIYHHDLQPYNVMYDCDNDCLTLIDGDSWNTSSYGQTNEEMRGEEEENFNIIKNHHNPRFLG